jgi:hypothetical protein
VTGSAGVPQMGAAIVLFDQQQHPVGRTLSNERGEFRFFGLNPSLYSVRVTLAAFVPAIRRDIMVQPGMRSLLAVNLSALFSSIQLGYPTVENGSLMTEDWKWGLRGDPATRPILRFLDSAASKPAPPTHSSVFTDTRGILRVSGGDAPVSMAANDADLGAAFALATSIFGNNTLEVSGNLAVGAQPGIPASAFRTEYRRNASGDGLRVSLTVRQLNMPGRMAQGAEEAALLPMLRAMSTSFDDRLEVARGVSVQYGLTADSVSFINRLTYFSPYARIEYSPDADTSIAFAFTSGNPRPDLTGSAPGDPGLQQDLNTLGMFPRISLRDARTKIQRGEEFELTASRKLGSRTVEGSVFSESVSNAALTMVAPDGMYASTDVLPDLFSGNSIFDAGNYRSFGYSASLTQNVGQNLSGSIILGSSGALAVDDRELMSSNPDELRSMIQASRKRSATARINATAPWIGTQVTASYQWSDNRWTMAGQLYSTQPSRPVPGLNVHVRQPLPGISGRPCRVELTADLRNLLAQGYLPLAVAGGQSVLLVEMPRSFRGGLNLIF